LAGWAQIQLGKWAGYSDDVYPGVGLNHKLKTHDLEVVPNDTPQSTLKSLAGHDYSVRIARSTGQRSALDGYLRLDRDGLIAPWSGGDDRSGHFQHRLKERHIRPSFGRQVVRIGYPCGSA